MSHLTISEKEDMCKLLLFAVLLFYQSINGQSDKKDSTTNSTVLTLSDVDEYPEFNGGIKSFYKFISDKFRLPEHNSGRILISMTIEADGSVGNVEVINGIDSITDKEAIRVVRLSPTWTPAKVKGKNVPVRMTFPIVVKNGS